MRRMRFGIIGCGAIACRAFLPALRGCDAAELAAIATRSPERAAELCREYDVPVESSYDALLRRDDVDAIYLATPVGTHVEWAVAAARTGKHVLCEKSLAPDLAATERMLSAAEDCGTALMEGYMYRFHPQHGVVDDLVAGGEIGSPVQFQAWFGIPERPPGDIRYSRALGGGALLDVGGYTLHAARRFFGREPVSVHAVLQTAGREVDLHGAALLDFEGATAQVAFGIGQAYRNSYSVWGETGQLTLLRAFAVPPTHAPELVIERAAATERRTVPPCDQFQLEIEAFGRGAADAATRAAWRNEARNQARVVAAVLASAAR